MLKKIKAIKYGSEEVYEIEVSLLATCTVPRCKNSAFVAIVFTEPYPPDDANFQGEFYYCKEHLVDSEQKKAL